MPIIERQRSVKLANRKRICFSLSGILIILHLGLWICLFLARAMLADAGGVIVVDDSNRLLVSVLQWVVFLLASPFYSLLAPGGFGILPLDIAGMAANSCLVGYGLAGGVRLVSTRQFSVRFLFAITTLTGLCLFALSLRNLDQTFVVLATAAGAALLLALVGRTRDTAQ